MKSLEVQACARLVEKADELGVEVPDRILEIAMGNVPTNGGAIMWMRLNPDLQEKDWPVGCCMPGDLNGPDFCVCWEPVFDLPQQDLQTVAAVGDCETRNGMCGDCAYRPNSPERNDGDGYLGEVLMDLPRSNTQVFYCHEGMRRPVKWVHPDGREVPGDPADYQPPRENGIPYRADGRPGLVCGGWAALRDAAQRELARHPVWLQELTGMWNDKKILPGGMVWVDEPPPVASASMGVGPGGTTTGRSRNEPTRRPGSQRAPVPGEAMRMPQEVRTRILGVLKRHPGRWARVHDGGHNGVQALSTWFRRHLGGLPSQVTTRREGLTVALYCRYVPDFQDVFASVEVDNP